LLTPLVVHWGLDRLGAGSTFRREKHARPSSIRAIILSLSRYRAPTGVKTWHHRSGGRQLVALLDPMVGITYVACCQVFSQAWIDPELLPITLVCLRGRSDVLPGRPDQEQRRLFAEPRSRCDADLTSQSRVCAGLELCKNHREGTMSWLEADPR